MRYANSHRQTPEKRQKMIEKKKMFLNVALREVLMLWFLQHRGWNSAPMLADLNKKCFLWFCSPGVQLRGQDQRKREIKAAFNHRSLLDCWPLTPRFNHRDSPCSSRALHNGIQRAALLSPLNTLSNRGVGRVTSALGVGRWGRSLLDPAHPLGCFTDGRTP